MFRNTKAKLLAGAMALCFGSLPLPSAPAHAALQVDVRVGFDQFYAALRPYGRWFHHARWGDVWRPTLGAGFRPYRNGHWEYTDYGWVWVSDYGWGDIAFHYGRWVYDPADGWLWVPGYVWAPAWVLWRSGDGYVGWCPMPPDNAFLAGDEIYPTAWDNADRAYGYMDWYGPNYGPNWFATDWVFVNTAHFADRDYSRYAVAGAQAAPIYRTSRDITRYNTANNYVVNRSVDPAVISRARGRAITAVPLRQAIRADAPVAPVNIGRQVQLTERRQHGGNPQAPANTRAVPLNTAAAPGRENRRNAESAAPGGPAAPPPSNAERPGRENRAVAGTSQGVGPAERPGREAPALATPGRTPGASPTERGPERRREAAAPPPPPAGFDTGPRRQERGPRGAVAPSGGEPSGFAGGPPLRPEGRPERGRFGGPPQGLGGPGGPPPGALSPAPPPQVALGPRPERRASPPGPPPQIAPPPAAPVAPPAGPPGQGGGPPGQQGGPPGQQGGGPPGHGEGHGKGH